MMTNDELKKKIMGILDQATGDWYEKDDGLFAEGYTPEEGDNRFKAFISDALIKAGLKFDTVVSHTATFDLLQQNRINELEKRIAKAEHRAQRAERAFKELCIDKIFGQNDEPSIKWTWDFYKARAEKELAEEQGDGKKKI